MLECDFIESYGMPFGEMKEYFWAQVDTMGTIIGFDSEQERDDYLDPADDHGNIDPSWENWHSKISAKDAIKKAAEDFRIEIFTNHERNLRVSYETPNGKEAGHENRALSELTEIFDEMKQGESDLLKGDTLDDGTKSKNGLLSPREEIARVLSGEDSPGIAYSPMLKTDKGGWVIISR